jgi:hypothetical protein
MSQELSFRELSGEELEAVGANTRRPMGSYQKLLRDFLNSNSQGAEVPASDGRNADSLVSNLRRVAKENKLNTQVQIVSRGAKVILLRRAAESNGAAPAGSEEAGAGGES